jgi:hypothetical protein
MGEVIDRGILVPMEEIAATSDRHRLCRFRIVARD